MPKNLNRDFYVKQFIGPYYFFMWPFKKQVEKWLE